MVVAAYLVGGFLVASVYAVGMLRGRTRPLPPARLHHRVHRRGDRDADPDGRRRRAGPLGLQQPAGQVRRDRAGARRPAATCPRRCSGHLNSERHGQRRASRSRAWPRGCPTRARARPRSSRASTRCPPTSGRPITQVNIVHLAWDVMVGLGTLLFLLSALVLGVAGSSGDDMPRSRWFLRVAAVRRRPRRDHAWRRAGSVSEVGRQPWIVYNMMKVEDAATAQHRGLDHVHRASSCSTSRLGVTTILVLRGDEPAVPPSRRLRPTHDVPYGPSAPPAATSPSAEEAVRMSTAVAVVLLLGGASRTPSSAAPTSAPASGTWSPAAPERGERPREVIDHSIGPVWEANHVWLIFIFVVLWTCVPGGVRLDHADPVRAADLAALGIVLRGASFAFRKAVVRTRDRRNFGAAFALSSVLVPVLHRRGRRRHRLRAGPGRRQGRRPVDSWVNPTSILGGVLAVVRRPPTSPPSSSSGTPAGSPTTAMVDVLPPPGRRRRRRRRRRRGRRASSCCAPTPPTSSTGSPRAPCRS